jgi:hypothetical protein
MNPCVKTGFMFYDVGSGIYSTGDLFYIAGLWQIRGIPKGEFFRPMPIDATVLNCVMAERADEKYMDSNFGIRLIACSEDFKQHLKEWYPELVEKVR